MNGSQGITPTIELASANCLYTTIRLSPCQPFFTFRKIKSRALRGSAFCSDAAVPGSAPVMAFQYL